MKCPCDGDSYDSCCGKYHKNYEDQPAPSALALMKSRYSAFVKHLPDYLWETTDPQVRDPRVHQMNIEWMKQVQFTRLEILDSFEDGNKGRVEFKAEYILNGETKVHSEKSKFRKQAGRWYYRSS
ncbi:MAG: YchJ family protein [Pseudobdellovibrionaceae bacterium]